MRKCEFFSFVLFSKLFWLLFCDSLWIFRMDVSVSAKKVIGFRERLRRDPLWVILIHLKNIKSSNPEAWNVFPFMYVFNFFFPAMSCSVYCTSLSLPWLIPKCFILFDAIVNGIVFLIFFRLVVVSVYKCNGFLCIDFVSYYFAKFIY